MTQVPLHRKERRRQFAQQFIIDDHEHRGGQAAARDLYSSPTTLTQAC